MKKLSRQEADDYLEKLFAQQKKITRLSAEVETTKTGGLFAKPRTTYATVHAELPNRLRMLDRGRSKEVRPPAQCLLILVDGQRFWELEPLYEGEKTRHGECRVLGDESGKGKGVGPALLGVDMDTPEGLRQKFDVNVQRVGGASDNDAASSYLVALQSLEDGRLREFWFADDAVLPYKMRTASAAKSAHAGKDSSSKKPLAEQVRLFKNVRTNLDGLPPFPADFFDLPLDEPLSIMHNGETMTEPEIRQAVRQARDGRSAHDHPAPATSPKD